MIILANAGQGASWLAFAVETRIKPGCLVKRSDLALDDFNGRLGCIRAPGKNQHPRRSPPLPLGECDGRRSVKFWLNPILPWGIWWKTSRFSSVTHLNP